MSIFTRFRDIISSNMNSMLDSAEDPDKMIKLMISEMEDTLIEIKASCAKVMADSKRIERFHDETSERSEYWKDKAKLAISKGRDDLAKEALLEKKKFTDQKAGLEREISELEKIIENYKNDIHQLEEKLERAREKQRILIQRQIHAKKKIRARQEMHRYDSSDAMMKFDKFETHIEKMEAEAELAGTPKGSNLEKKFDSLMADDDIEKELQDLKEMSEKEKKK